MPADSVIIHDIAPEAARIRAAQADAWQRLGFCGRVIELLQKIGMEHVGTDGAYRGSHEFRMKRGELEYIAVSIDPQHTEKDIIAAIYLAGRRDLRTELNELDRRRRILLGRSPL